jgi:hypothetical protein
MTAPKGYDKRRRQRDRTWATYQGIRNRCQVNKTPCCTFTEFKLWLHNQEAWCFYCHCELTRGNGLTARTVDRLNPNEGYETYNMVLACRQCNIIKGNWFTPEQMLDIAERYLNR